MWVQIITIKNNIPESVLKNETHKLLWDFEIQTDHLISTRRPRPSDNQQKKKNLPNCKLCRPSRPKSLKLKENKKKDKYLDLARELKKLWIKKVMAIPTVIGCV